MRRSNIWIRCHVVAGLMMGDLMIGRPAARNVVVILRSGRTMRGLREMVLHYDLYLGSAREYAGRGVQSGRTDTYF